MCPIAHQSFKFDPQPNVEQPSLKEEMHWEHISVTSGDFGVTGKFLLNLCVTQFQSVLKLLHSPESQDKSDLCVKCCVKLSS